MARYDGLIMTRSWNEYINKSDAATLAQALQQNNVLDNTPTENSTKGVRSGGVYDALATKQPTLTFDDVPTDGSNNPVKSNGIYAALATKQDTLTFDNAPTQESDNPVKSGGVYTALGGKQDTLTFDDVPTASSNNPVKSGGVYSDIHPQSVIITEYGIININGYITNDAKSIHIFIPMNIKSGSTITISELKVTGRHVGGGYIDANYTTGFDALQSPYSIFTSVVPGLGIGLEITKSTSFVKYGTSDKILNNTPVDLTFKLNMTIS